jgi:serine/threonine protein kinase
MAQNQAQSLVGRQVGPYKIHSLLGVGGMGEVYLAQDPRLDRDIALKILPTELASDPARIQRFIREARAASGLKHPNVATIYEIGKSDEIHFIAMEYVEGRTLADKISGRPLPTAEIVDIGIQVADALDEAHRKGITHRDIKPANLMLTSREQVKILDFGLAKVTQPEGHPIGSDISTVMKTETGVVMGTVQYMSPEQVLGKAVDSRTDIFSLGVVLYEMATGRLPFTGTSSSETMDRVLHGQPEAIARFNYDAPAELERIIRKCLEKDREGRYQLAREVRADLSSLKEERSRITVGTSPASSQSVAQRKKSRTWLGAGLGLVALVAVGAGLYFFRREPVSRELPSLPIPLTSYPGTELSPSFSPDGSQVAFSWDGEHQDNFDIYVKLIDRVEKHRLTTDPARDMSPAWAPDGRTIAFAREGAVYLISPIGGRERKLADVRAADIDWTADSRSLIVSGRTPTNSRLLIISVDSGKTTELTSPPGEGLGIGDFSLAVSPDGLQVAFIRVPANGGADVYQMPMTGENLHRLTQNEGPIYGLTWTIDGREVVYSAQGSLRRRFVKSRVDSPPTRVEGVDPGGATAPMISHPTSASPVRLAYERLVLETKVWVKDTKDPSAPARKLIGWTQSEGNPQFSPDGRQIAFLSDISGSYQIWIANSDGSNPLRLTSLSTGDRNSPRWSPDGRKIVFAWIQNNNRDLYSISVDGTSLRQLTKEPSQEGRPSWSRDGRWIYCYSDRTGRTEIWRIPAEGGGEGSRLTTDGGHESFESPDGKLLYYEDYGNQGLKSIPIQAYSGPREGSVVLEKVRPGFWAVAEKGIYFVEFDDRYAASQFIQYAFVVGTTGVPLPIRFYDFQSRKISQIGAIDKGVIRHNSSFSVTWDGGYIAWSQIDRGESDLMMVENFR